jgi:hypothetical protein
MMKKGNGFGTLCPCLRQVYPLPLSSLSLACSVNSKVCLPLTDNLE